MKLSTPLDKARITSHFQYNGWKYVVLALLSVFLWNVVYSVTEYRAPQGKRIDIYTQNAYSSQEQMLKYLDDLRQRVVPGVEVVTCATLLGGGENDIYSVQQLTTYIAAREGDLFFLNGADFKRYASQGVFLELAPLLEDGLLQLDGIALSSGYIAMQEYDEEAKQMKAVSQRRLYGIPLSSLTGFSSRLGIHQQDMCVGITIYNENDSQVITYLNALIQEMRPDHQPSPEETT